MGLVGADVSEDRIASIIRVTIVLTANVVPSLIAGGAMFLRIVGSYKSHTALTSQKMPFFIVTAVKIRIQ
jgi:hypothetical protein